MGFRVHMARIAFLFPGQGVQTVGMAKALCESQSSARRLFHDAGEVLGYDLLDVCANGPADRINATDVSQPAIYVASLAALEVLKLTQPGAVANCVAAAGLSLGEYTALAFAGALSFRDGLKVVQIRGRAMQTAGDAIPGGMVGVLGPDAAEVEAMCTEARSAGLIQVANLLCPNNTAVSGTIPACEAIEKIAEARGARTVRLAVAGAFHTSLMKPADETLAAALSNVEIHSPRVPVWSNVDARPHSDPDEIRNLLIQQVLSPVFWEQTVRNLLAEGCDKFYEIGPGRVLAGLLKRVHRKADCVNV